MAINLVKGQKIDLTKGNTGLSKVKVGLGWDTNKYEGGNDFDLDSCVAMLNAEGKCNNDADFIYFSNLKGNGIKHHGDNLTGAGDGDDEVIEVDLTEIPEDIMTLDLHVIIYNAEERKQNFGQIANVFVRVVDASNNTELVKYEDLGEEHSVQTRLNIGKLYRYNKEWKFQAIGVASEGGFNELLSEVGLG